MQTVKDIRRRATSDLRQRIFRSGVFRRKQMKEVANAISRKHTSGLSAEDLLILARHDTWLKSGRGGRSPYPGEKTNRIAEELESFLRSELRVLVDSFWNGRTSVELAVRRSSAELAGFFNGVRPNCGDTPNDSLESSHERQLCLN